jgi:hypothetical protein
MQDLIQDILTLIDRAQEPEPQLQAQVTIIGQPELNAEPVGQDSPLTHAPDDIRRFRQIVDLGSDPVDPTAYANAPQEKVAGIEAVTTDAGGGWMAPKHPHDIRVKDISAYPNQQEV